MNKNIRHLCCVCSGNGEHDLFGRIPVNVHANPNEFRFWRATIAEMIADISGIYVSKIQIISFYDEIPELERFYDVIILPK